jgi:hypothetical protein
LISGKRRREVCIVVAVATVVSVVLALLVTYFGGTLDVLVGLTHAALVIILARLLLMPRLHFEVGIPMSWLWLGLLVQLGFSAAMAYLTGSIIGGDATVYHRMAVAIASGTVEVSTLRWYGTPVVAIVAAAWYRLIGVSFLGMYFLAGLTAYAAKCLVIRAASCMTNDSGIPRSVAAAMLWLPSFSLWNGILGKEPYVCLGVAATICGVAALEKYRRYGFMCFLVGVTITGLIRPHFAAIELASLVMAGVMSKEQRRVKLFVPVAMILLVLLVGSDAFQSFTGAGGFGPDDAVSALSSQSAALARGGGGSSTGIAIASKGVVGYLTAIPISAATMLLMPYPGQFREPLQLLASIETLLVFVVILIKAPRSLSGALRDRRLPALYGWSFVGAFVVIMGPVLAVNVGLMARQRTILWLVLAFTLMTSEPRRVSPMPSMDRAK